MEVTQERDAYCAAQFGDYSDQDLGYATVALDQKVMEHQAYCCCDDQCVVSDDVRRLRAMIYEGDRRVRLGIEVTGPNDTTLEQRLGAYGIEYQLEQEERFLEVGC